MNSSNELNMEGKRKKVVLTIKEKLDVITHLEKGETVVSVSDLFGISTTTVRDIKKNKSNLFDFITRMEGTNSMKRKSMKKSKYEEVDVALLDWFVQKRAGGLLISGPMCVRQAKFFHQAFGLEGKFNASTGWLTRFKQRYGICEIVEESPTIHSTDDNQFITLENIQNNNSVIPGKKMPTKRTLAFDIKKYDQDPLSKVIDFIDLNNPAIAQHSTGPSEEIVGDVKNNTDISAIGTEGNETAYLTNKDAISSINNVLIYMRQSGFDAKDMAAIKRVKKKICAIGKVLSSKS